MDERLFTGCLWVYPTKAETPCIGSGECTGSEITATSIAVHRCQQGQRVIETSVLCSLLCVIVSILNELLEMRLLRILKKYLDCDDQTIDEQLLNQIGIVKYPEQFEFCGPISLNFPDGKCLDSQI